MKLIPEKRCECGEILNGWHNKSKEGIIKHEENLAKRDGYVRCPKLAVKELYFCTKTYRSARLWYYQYGYMYCDVVNEPYIPKRYLEKAQIIHKIKLEIQTLQQKKNEFMKKKIRAQELRTSKKKLVAAKLSAISPHGYAFLKMPYIDRFDYENNITVVFTKSPTTVYATIHLPTHPPCKNNLFEYTGRIGKEFFRKRIPELNTN